MQLMKIWILSIAWIITACTAQSTGKLSPTIKEPASSSFRSDLPVLGKAPELTNEIWLNTNEPLRLEKLRGKVVLLDMWTFG
jgi:hypothetical protein